METEYLKFIDGPSESGKTVVSLVVSKSQNIVLGQIKWFGRWRQYCFYPKEDTIWNKDCLIAVGNKIFDLNEQQRRSRKRAKK